MTAINTTQKRLRILGEDEIEDLYERPRFTREERIQYFSISPTEKAALEQLHSIKSQIYFILQSGYFKARHMFLSSTFETSKRMLSTYGNNTSPTSNSMSLRLPKLPA